MLDLNHRAEPPAAPAAPRVLLRRVTLPGYLDTTDLLSRRGSSELVASSRGRWAERLSDGVNRALAEGMERRPGPGAVLRPEADAGAGELAPLELFVEIDTIECREGGGACRLEARWSS